MNKLELIQLHALSLEQSLTLKKKDIVQFLCSFSYENVNTFSELKELLNTQGYGSYYPDEKAWNGAQQTLEKNAELDIHTILISSSSYPKSLKAIDDPPPIIHLRGNLECLNRIPGVAVVGSRKVTKNGELIARRISAFLAENGWCIVSGLAIGVDTAAHQGALSISGSGNTIAVLAHGLEHARPQRNIDLAMEIIDRGGLWISEHRVGTPAKPEHFVPRNRIQLGLSSGSVIIEAEKQSGTITQAKFCLKQKRPLFAVVPHKDSNPLQLLSSGTEMLVNEMGAFPLKTKEDYFVLIERLMKQKELLSAIE
ncbi:MAG TPA: DNA-processing protein DprA [Methylophaga aminisulfidivorans]|uniref:DNA-processing protein DprA n=1 Tax=Methylophaga TaxID=40222 RepID=UPI00175E2244|nr:MULTISPECIES: DNA-processing protein DprA [Methylophaga]HIC46408.1 DNA-processing protein DprA [Methylophaga sp.]HIM40017.1 DNA-processing protein DprA [Methylophaga aminisulfidivorans]